MPNYCQNELKVSGDKNILERFKKAAGTEKRVLDFNVFVTYPKELEEADEKWNEWWDKRNKCKTAEDITAIGPAPYNAYDKEGYDWCIRRWGTKWNSIEPNIVDDGKALLYDFDTAWSPPCPIVLEMSKKFPDLKFTLKYWEGGSGFKGVFKCVDGGVTKTEMSSYRGHRGG